MLLEFNLSSQCVITHPLSLTMWYLFRGQACFKSDAYVYKSKLLPLSLSYPCPSPLKRAGSIQFWARYTGMLGEPHCQLHLFGSNPVIVDRACKGCHPSTNDGVRLIHLDLIACADWVSFYPASVTRLERLPLQIFAGWMSVPMQEDVLPRTSRKFLEQVHHFYRYCLFDPLIQTPNKFEVFSFSD